MTQKPQDQQALLALLRQRDEAAYVELVRAELPRIFNLCLRLCGKKEDAEDICQETFIRAVRGIDGFKGDSSLSTWLYRIAVNVWKNRIRYESRRFFNFHFSIFGKRNGDDEDKKDFDVRDTAPGPDMEVERSDEHSRILRAIQQLDSDERAMVILRDIEERSYEEISSFLDLNIGTVKSRLSRAREHLREIFQRLEQSKL